MKISMFNKGRRDFLGGIGTLSALTFFAGPATLLPQHAIAQMSGAPSTQSIKSKEIPSTGENIPVIGMGTWITFNVGNNTALRNQRAEILREFFAKGGEVIDCSPMYGTSADVLGYTLNEIGNPEDLFAASKVWTSSTGDGISQMETQRQSWDINKFDLMQIHNLRNWEGHLDTLKRMKADGEIRYIGITTSHGRRHRELENIMKDHEIDFVQLTYNIADREAEERLLPLARERGIAVIANRPYKGGELFNRYQGRPLPNWAKEEAGVQNWADYFLKFIVSHDAATCAIPATTKIEHMKENMGAGYGQMPDPATRQKMIRYLENI